MNLMYFSGRQLYSPYGEWAEVAGGEENENMFDVCHCNIKISLMLMNRFSPLPIWQIVSVGTMFFYVFCLL